MARTQAVLPDGARLSDYLSVGSDQFLLAVQSEETAAGRAFVMGSWYHVGGIRAHKWPNAKVYYFFDTTVPTATKSWMSWMRGSMNRMTSGTGMTFREADWLWWHEFWWNLGASNYARISLGSVTGGDGEATVGKTTKAYLRMEAAFATREGLFNHEMGHVFGLLHEHQRHDRDTYIRVPSSGDAKIPSGWTWCSYFLWWTSCTTRSHSDTYGTPFDYQSIMHYLSNNTTRIRLRSSDESLDNRCWSVWQGNQGEWGATNGGTFFTPWDIYAIRRLYGISPNALPTGRPVVGQADLQACTA